MSAAGPFVAESFGDGVCSLRVSSDRDPYMGQGWGARLMQVLHPLAQDPRVRAVVLAGGERHFSTGARREALLGVGAQSEFCEQVAQAARALLDLPVPVVAAMAGHAIGGGLLIGLWCDALVLAEEGLYGANFIALGFTPGMGATCAVPEAFGPALGRQMLLSGRLLTGRDIQAAACPLSHAVRPKAEVYETALALARDMADAPRAALVLLKQTLARPRIQALEQALAVERTDHERIFADPRTFEEIACRYPARAGRTEPDQRAAP
jgi:enoyl-CoA hydratase/carnithine racemase